MSLRFNFAAKKQKFFSLIAFIAMLIIPWASFCQPLTQSPNVIKEKWHKAIPKIRAILIKQFGESEIERDYKLGIDEISDLTGSGNSEALIYLGTGGAYTSTYVLMSLEKGEPAFMKFKLENGKIDVPVFLGGSSVMNSEIIEMLPAKHAISATHCSADVKVELYNCSVEYYQYNPATKLFEYDAKLSKAFRRAFQSE